MPIFEVEILDYYMCIFNLELVMCMYVCVYVQICIKTKKKKRRKSHFIKSCKVIFENNNNQKKTVINLSRSL